MLIKTARGRLIGGGAILLIIAASFGWWSLSESPTPERPVSARASAPVDPPAAPQPQLSPPKPALDPAPQPEPVPPVALATPPALSPAEERARATVGGYEAERERILAELEGQTLEETISQALHVWPADAFTTGFSRGPFVNDRQKYLLQDPRLARILHAAVNGTEEERAVIRSQVMQTIESILAERQKRDEGLPYDESLLDIAPGKEIYPLILAEVDSEGSTLPLLLKWYDADRGPEWNEAQLRSLEEKIESLGGTPGKIDDVVTGDVLLITAAARRIADRIGEPLQDGEGTVLDPLGDGESVFPGGKFDVPMVDELRGYSLFEELMLFECDQIMNNLRTRLQQNVS